MVQNKGKHYLYLHTRLDKNEVFYVGIGTKSNRNYKSTKSIYYRAYNKQGRNRYWKNIISKTAYKIDIILESDDYNFIKQKEKEFISYYNTVCNLTKGGDGTLGVHKPKSKDSKFSKSIYQYNLNGEFMKRWFCGKDIENDLNFHSNAIYDCCNGNNRTAYGFQWSYVKHEKLGKVKKNEFIDVKKVKQVDKFGNIVKTWDSTFSISQELNLHRSHITACCNGKRKTTGGYRWEYIKS